MLKNEGYRGVLAHLDDVVRRKNLELWGKQSWILKHGNAPVRNCLEIYQTPVVPYPSYSTDIVQENLFLFPKRKTILKRCRFRTTEGIKDSKTREMRDIAKNAARGVF